MDYEPDLARPAPGHPGLPPTWSPGAKDLVVTAIGSSQIWATIGQGIVQEVFWPSAGRPQVRDLGFLVVGPDFWSEPKAVGDYQVTAEDPFVPAARIVHHHPRYTLTLEVVVDPERDVVLIHHELQGIDCRLIVLISPHLSGSGANDTAWFAEGALLAGDGEQAMAVVSDQGFSQTSVGFVGTSDGWQDLNTHGDLRWDYTVAAGGNVAMTGALVAPSGTLALGLATNPQGAVSLARASLVDGWSTISDRFVAGWRAHGPNTASLAAACPPWVAAALATSEMVLSAHQDHTFPGAIVASLASPWGDSREDRGGYHLVWPRDAVESGLALVALGRFEDARRLLAHLMSNQQPDGHWRQNWFSDGSPYWTGIQLDETALPVLLAAKLAEAGELASLLQPAREMAQRACAFLAAAGPVSPQDRWEENSGISPFTLATCIAALAAASELSFLEPEQAASAAALAVDWDHAVEQWAYATATELDAAHGTAGHYIRLGALGSPGNRGRIVVRNRDGDQIEANEFLGLEFLALVRFGLRQVSDPRIVDTVRLVDALLRVELDGRPYYHRYQDDGYGEHDDGAPFDGTGVGRVWPLLTAERAVYASVAGEDVDPYLRAIVDSVTAGGMIPEQVWNGADLPDHRLSPGKPTGSAAPLVWAHAELIKLAAAVRDGCPIERLACIDAHVARCRPSASIARDPNSAPSEPSGPARQGGPR